MIDLIQYLFFYFVAIAIICISGLFLFNLTITILAIIGINFKTGKFWKSVTVLFFVVMGMAFIDEIKISDKAEHWVRPEYSYVDEFDDPPRCYGGNICE